MMKNSLIRSLVTWLCVAMIFSLTSAAFALEADVDVMKTSEEVENRVAEKIKKNLDMFVSKEQYRLFTTAKINKFREKVILKGEMEQKSRGKESNELVEVMLPGFQDVESRQQDPKDVDRKEASKFEFRTRILLESLAVRLVLDKALAQEVKDLAINSTKDVIDQSVGDKGKLDTVELDLTKEEVSQTPWEWLLSYLKERGATGIDLLYIFGLLVLFLAAILALRHYYKNQKKAKELELAGEGNKGDDNEDEMCNLLLDEMIHHLNKSPLITRIFLKNLSPGDRVTIFHSIKTPAMKSFFQKVLMIDELTQLEKTNQNAKETLEAVLKDLKRFIELNQEMEQKPFGYVIQLTGEQVNHFLQREADKFRSLLTIAPYLSNHQMKEVTSSLSVDEKTEFFEALNVAENFNISGVEVSRDEKNAVESRLKSYYASVKHESVVDVARPEAIELSFLESDRQSVDVIRKLAERRGQVPKAYEKYLVTFEDFLGLELGITKKVMQKVSNEILIKAFKGRPVEEEAKPIIGEMRTQLIQSLMKRGDKVSEEDVLDAQNEVLKMYRALS